ncbi:hypothetical protein, partial [Sphingomonas sp. UV9]|uniref:hypothetical protein n=1 Tax=Sphingomonas sp. UV9 TaxID=1851410 RepID=UPI0019D121B6
TCRPIMFVILRRLSGVNHASSPFASSRFSTVSVGCDTSITRQAEVKRSTFLPGMSRYHRTIQ